MSTSLPRAGMHVVWMTAKRAEAHDRMVHNVPAHARLGWRPYRFRVTERALPVTAFVTQREFKRWLKRAAPEVKLALAPHSGWDTPERGLRMGFLVLTAKGLL